MPPSPPRSVRIFISSPSDVRPERAATLRALERLNRRYAGLLQIDGVFWEDSFFPSTVDFQSWINERTPPWACDLVVCILWSRIGTPLAATWPPRDDGTPYESGTVAEFEMTRQRALTAHTPDLYMFIKTAAPPVGASSDELALAAAAKRVVEQFVHRWFHQAETVPVAGQAAPARPFTAGLNPFSTTDAFEEMAVRFLEYWLRDKGWIDRPVTWDVHTQGLPYVGLAAFTPTHSAVFFGRDADRRMARRLLVDADAAGLPYLLLTGGSGVGKSSLARAGLVPDLCVDTPQEVWANAVVLAGPEPLQHLAEALLDGECVLAPHLADSFFPDAARLAPALADPATAVSILIGALDALAQEQRSARGWEQAPQARLLLVIDQAEALADSDPAAQRIAVAVLAALAATRRIWLVATLRLDRVAALLATPPLTPLVTRDLRGQGQEGVELKLTAPDEAALRDIIEAPAHAAGLSFEERDGRSLAEELRGEIAGQPDALPLLQRMLETLFGEGRVALWARYEAIGRLSGAIAAAADEALAKTPAASRAELRPLILALTGQLGEDGAAVGRPTDRAAFETTPARAALVQALLHARLLATDGRGQLRVAHEALLRTWPQAQTILTQAADFLRLRDRLRQPAAEFASYGTVLPPGPLLASAQAALPALRAERETLPLAALVDASLTADRRDRRRRTTALSVVSIVLALLASGAGIGFWQARKAQLAAEAATKHAEANLNAAENAVSNLVFDLAQKLEQRMGVPVDLLRDILGVADRALAGLERASPDEPRVRFLRAVALSETSEVLAKRGDRAGARRAAEASREVIAQLAASDPENKEWQRDLSVTDNKVGDLLKAQGYRVAAMTAYRAGMAIAERLVAFDPKNDEWQRDLAISNNKIGDLLLLQGDRVGALASYHAGTAIHERLAAIDPKNTEWQRDLAISQETEGGMLLEQGDFTGALVTFRRSLEIREHLADSDPTNAEYQRDLAIGKDNVADVLAAQDDRASALDLYRASLQIRERLTASDTNNSRWQRDLSVSHERIGNTLKDDGDLDGALKEYTVCKGIDEKLAAADPDNTEWQSDLSTVNNKIGDVLTAQDDKVGALAAYRTAMAIRERLAARDHDYVDWQRAVAISNNKIGDALLAADDKPGALASYRASLAIVERLVAIDPGRADLQRDLWIGLAKVARALVGLDAIAEACPVAQRLAKQADFIGVHFPQDPERDAYQRLARAMVEQACTPEKPAAPDGQRPGAP